MPAPHEYKQRLIKIIDDAYIQFAEIQGSLIVASTIERFKLQKELEDLQKQINTFEESLAKLEVREQIDPTLPLSFDSINQIEYLSKQFKDLEGTLIATNGQFEKELQAKQYRDVLVEIGERILKLDESHQPTKVKVSILYWEKGENCRKVGDNKNAATYYTRAIELHNGTAEYHFALGIIYIDLNDYESAINSLSIAWDLNPFDMTYLEYLGIAYFKAANYSRAIDVFNTYSQAQPTNSNVLYFRGQSYWELGNKDFAIKDVRHSANLANQLAIDKLHEWGIYEPEKPRKSPLLNL